MLLHKLHGLLVLRYGQLLLMISFYYDIDRCDFWRDFSESSSYGIRLLVLFSEAISCSGDSSRRHTVLNVGHLISSTRGRHHTSLDRHFSTELAHKCALNRIVRGRPRLCIKRWGKSQNMLQKIQILNIPTSLPKRFHYNIRSNPQIVIITWGRVDPNWPIRILYSLLWRQFPRQKTATTCWDSRNLLVRREDGQLSWERKNCRCAFAIEQRTKWRIL